MTDNSSATGSTGDLGGFGIASKSIQSFATEVARLSKETMDETTHMAEKLRGAKTLEEVVSIQTSYVQKSFSKYADYTKRMGELFTALPMEMAKQSQAVLHKNVATGMKAADALNAQTQQMTDQAVQHTEQAVHQMQEAVPHMDPAPDQYNQNFNNGGQQHDQHYDNNQNNHDQNYNNQHNYNNQNY